jgi:hypothetical protein
MEPLYINNLWKGIIELTELVFSETYLFPLNERASLLSKDLRMDVLFIASKFANTVEGQVSPENLLPFFLIDERLSRMERNLLDCYEEKWVVIAKYYFIKQLMESIRGQIVFRIDQFSIQPFIFLFPLGHQHNKLTGI